MPRPRSPIPSPMPSIPFCSSCQHVPARAVSPPFASPVRHGAHGSQMPLVGCFLRERKLGTETSHNHESLSQGQSKLTDSCADPGICIHSIMHSFGNLKVLPSQMLDVPVLCKGGPRNDCLRSRDLYDEIPRVLSEPYRTGSPTSTGSRNPFAVRGWWKVCTTPGLVAQGLQRIHASQRRLEGAIGRMVKRAAA